jgi:hypothetical protein
VRAARQLTPEPGVMQALAAVEKRLGG